MAFLSIIATVLFLAAGIGFIMGLKMLGRAETARRGNLLSAAAMLAAAVGTVLAIWNSHGAEFSVNTLLYVIIGLVIGTVIGFPAAKLVKMTAMPEMVAIFNGFGGIASLLVGWSQLQSASVNHAARVAAGESTLSFADMLAELGGASGAFVAITIFLAVLIGGVTFTGSLIAFGKLSGKLDSKPVLYTGQQIVNVVLLFGALACGVLLAMNPENMWLLYIVVPISLILGVAFVIPIGGGDMPVVISLLNSYSGLAACAAGFAIGNILLIITGALVGASGIILTRIMCLAMNRSLGNVLFSGFGAADSGGGGSKKEGEKKEANIMTPDQAYYMLEAASSVIFVPGYGMAVAQAQHAVKELAGLLEHNGCEVRYAVHPVAGRMPGHMNVLLAEADVDYEALAELDDVNPTMETVDVAIVIGANDVVNPDALDDPDSVIYGMPIVEVHRAKQVFTLKRTMGAGYAGIQNPLFFIDNNAMILGDAKKTISALADEFKGD